MKTIWFDMDGTIADFYSVENWLDKILNNDTSPYADAAPMYDMTEISTLINHIKEKGYDIGIISYVSKKADAEMCINTAEVKRDWIKNYFPFVRNEMVHIARHSVPKNRFGKKGDILVDDELKNRLDWRENGYSFSSIKELAMFI